MVSWDDRENYNTVECWVDDKHFDSIEQAATFLSERFDEEYCEDDYADMLDEVYGTVEIAGQKFCTSYALEKLDPVSYHIGLTEYVDQRQAEMYDEYYWKIHDIKEGEFEMIDGRCVSIPEPYDYE